MISSKPSIHQWTTVTLHLQPVLWMWLYRIVVHDDKNHPNIRVIWPKSDKWELSFDLSSTEMLRQDVEWAVHVRRPTSSPESELCCAVKWISSELMCRTENCFRNHKVSAVQDDSAHWTKSQCFANVHHLLRCNIYQWSQWINIGSSRRSLDFTSTNIYFVLTTEQGAAVCYKWLFWDVNVLCCFPFFADSLVASQGRASTELRPCVWRAPWVRQRPISANNSSAAASTRRSSLTDVGTRFGFYRKSHESLLLSQNRSVHYKTLHFIRFTAGRVEFGVQQRDRLNRIVKKEAAFIYRTFYIF